MKRLKEQPLDGTARKSPVKMIVVSEIELTAILEKAVKECLLSGDVGKAIRMGINDFIGARCRIYEKAMSNMLLPEADLLFEQAPTQSDIKIINMIKSEKCWERNDYESFITSLSKSKRKSYLTSYTPEELRKNNIQTFKLKGYDIGYALKPCKDDTEIISVHNNEPDIHNVGDEQIQSAIRNGGNKLDHFDGFLSNFYQRNGFYEYERWKWDDNYAPINWNFEQDGKPDVIFRKLRKQ